MAAIKRGGAATIRMMLWMLSLGGAIYLSMLFVGRDHGQQRQGLASKTPVTISFPEPVAPAAVASSPVEAPPPAKHAPAVPAAPGATEVTVAADAVASKAETPTVEATATSLPVLPQIGAAADVTLPPETLLQPGETLGDAMVITARGAVVREGPGIQYKLVGRLTNGAEVQLVDQPTKLVGWAVIQFKDGNGVIKQGYVASGLLGKKH